METRREVYSSAPLVMILLEVRYTYLPELDGDEARARVMRAVKDRMPILVKGQKIEFDVGGGNTAPRATQQLEARSEDRQTTAEVSTERFGVTMSGAVYDHYEVSLRPLVLRLVEAILTEAPGLFVTRVGLRYIDEVRWPGEAPETVSSWGRYIDPGRLDVAGAMNALDCDGIASRASATIELDQHKQVTANWGTFFGASVVGQDHPFALPNRPPERMFVIDMDVSWNSPDAPERHDAEALISRMDELHGPARVMFESFITEAAREMFRGK